MAHPVELGAVFPILRRREFAAQATGTLTGQIIIMTGSL